MPLDDADVAQIRAIIRNELDVMWTDVLQRMKQQLDESTRVEPVRPAQDVTIILTDGAGKLIAESEPINREFITRLTRTTPPLLPPTE